MGDSRKMSEIDDSSVHLIITSPPYWQLKDYGTENQIGFHESYESYINNLNLVWKECFRVLNDGCRLCVNIGDQFARAIFYGRYKVIPIREEIIKFCEIVGFDYMGAVIWQKVTTSNTTGGGVQMGSYPYPRNGILKIDYEFILIFKKPGEAPKVSKEIKEYSKMTTEEWNTFFAGHWNFPGAKQSEHIAMFPEELPRRLIKMFSFIGEIVLDPFAGSGTTALAARNLERNSISYEINKDFIEVIRQKLEIDVSDLFGTSYQIIEQKKVEVNFEEECNKLPYIFKDPHKLNKKIDVKKIKFGSKIDGRGEEKRENYYTVKEIISPEILKLNNELKIKLIGIKENLSVTEEAKGFIYQKTKGKRVYLKYDSLKYDEDNNMLCYLYLENKLFLNAHIIKNGFALVDDSISFKYSNKFNELYMASLK